MIKVHYEPGSRKVTGKFDPQDPHTKRGEITCTSYTMTLTHVL